MDKNFIRIDDLVRQHLEGAEEQERSGAWLNMRDLLDKEMPRKKRIGVFYWRRLFGLVAAVSLIGTVAVGSYELSSAYRSDDSDLVPLTMANPVASRESGNAVLETQGAENGNEPATAGNITVRGNEHLSRIAMHKDNIASSAAGHENTPRVAVPGNAAPMAAHRNNNGEDLSASVTAHRRMPGNTDSKAGTPGVQAARPGSTGNKAADNIVTAVAAHAVPDKPLTGDNPKARSIKNTTDHNTTITDKSNKSYTAKNNRGTNQTTSAKATDASPVAGSLAIPTGNSKAATAKGKAANSTAAAAKPDNSNNNGAHTAAKSSGAAIAATVGKGAQVAKNDAMPGTDGRNGLPRDEMGALNSSTPTGLTTPAPTAPAPVATTVVTADGAAATDNTSGKASGTDGNKTPVAVTGDKNTGKGDAPKGGASGKAVAKDNGVAKTGTPANNAAGNQTTAPGNSNSVTSKAGNTNDAAKGTATAAKTTDMTDMPLAGTVGKSAAGTKPSTVHSGGGAAKNAGTTTTATNNTKEQAANTTAAAGNSKKAGNRQAGRKGTADNGSNEEDNQHSDNKVMNKVVVRERQVQMNDNETRTQVDTLSVETMNRGGGNDNDGADEAVAAKTSAKKAENNTGTEDAAVASGEPESGTVTAKRRRGRARRNAANISASMNEKAGNEETAAADIVPAAAMPAATADEATASANADENTEAAKKAKTAKRSGVSLMEKMRAAFNDVKQNASGAKFHAGITAGFNNNFFGPSNMRGFQFGMTGNMEFNESWNMMAELKYFHRINNNTIDDSYYNYKQIGNQYRRSMVQNSYDFAAMHTIEMPVTIRYAKGNFNFYTGGNFLYSFSINTAPATYADPNAVATFVNAPGADNAPKYNQNDFHSRFGLGYIFGFSYQVAPNTTFDIRNVQTVWDNAATTGAKSISAQLYKTPSVQLSIMYRLGGNRNKE